MSTAHREKGVEYFNFDNQPFSFSQQPPTPSQSYPSFFSFPPFSTSKYNGQRARKAKKFLDFWKKKWWTHFCLKYLTTFTGLFMSLLHVNCSKEKVKRGLTQRGIHRGKWSKISLSPHLILTCECPRSDGNLQKTLISQNKT